MLSATVLQTKIFQVQTKIFQVQKKILQVQKTIWKKYGNLKVARGSEGICAWISQAENECQKSRDKQMSCDSHYTTAGGAVESV